MELGAMTPRERWLATISFQSVSSIINHEMGFWTNDNFANWHRQGLPDILVSEGDILDYFGRYPFSSSIPLLDGWDVVEPGWADASRPLALGCSVGSIIGLLRNELGLEGLAYAMQDTPDLIRERVNANADMAVNALNGLPRNTILDWIWFWEDMAGNNGPLVSPKWAYANLAPAWESVVKAARKLQVKVCWVDCDGDIMQFLPIWKDCGINGLFPIQRIGGTDPYMIRKRYGEAFVFLGGLDKRALYGGREMIDDELKYVRPLVKEGGWIPGLDHACPPDVPYDNYCYYREQKQGRLLWS